MKNPTIIIGLDGATFKLLTPWIEKGFLPNLANIFKNGTSGTLKSVMPPVTGPAIASFATGKRPGKTGVFDLFKKQPDSYKITPVDPSVGDNTPFWQVINQFNKSVGVFNLPLTFPPDNVNGFMVSGRFSPKNTSRLTYPVDLFEKLEVDIENYDIDSPGYLAKYEQDYDGYLREELKNIQKKSAIAFKLAQQRPQDVMLFYFGNPDMAQHLIWHCMGDPNEVEDGEPTLKNGLLKIYQEIDKFIGKLNQLFESPTYFLMSDHGFGPKDYDININKFLIDEGFMKLKKKPAAKARKQNVQAIVFGAANLIKNNFSENSLPMRTLKAIRKIVYGSKVKDSIFPEQKDTFILKEGLEINWDQTSIYPLGGMGNLCINLKGRDPNGIISPGQETTDLINRFKKSLAKLRDQSDQPIVEHVFTKEEVFAGPHLEKAPDLVCYSEKNILFYYPQFDKLDQPTVAKNLHGYWSGNHDINGIWAAQGPNIKPTQKIDCEIIDLIPSILHYLDLPIPSDCDGRVVAQAFTSPIANREIKHYNPSLNNQQNSLTDKEKSELNKRLENLGYLA